MAAPCYRARVRGTAIAAVIALVAGAQPARAEDGEAGERVVLVAPPAGLDEAVRAALAGWPIEVVIEPEGAPGSTMPGSAARARALAEGHGAAAVVWLGRDDGGLALWVYDRESGRAVTRPLPAAPPYDEPTAAAVALTVKTLLRHSTAAPAPARYGASEAAAATGGELASAPATAPDAAPIRQRALVRLDTLAGARLRRTEAADLELRLGVGAELTPGWPLGLAAYLLLRSGAGTPVDHESYVGRYTDLQISAGARARLPLSRRVALAPRLGGSAHITEIDGAIRASGARGRADRVNPSIDAGLALDVDVGRSVRLSAEVEGSVALRRQEYRVAGAPVLTLPRLEGELRLAASFPFE